MSPPGRPKDEAPSAQREGKPSTPPGRPKGESPSAQREGKPSNPPGRPKGESPSAQRAGKPSTPPHRLKGESQGAQRTDEPAAAPPPVFTLDGADVPFAAGQTVIQAALAAGRYVPHLCYHAEFKPHGSCKVCTLKADGHWVTSCTLPAQTGMQVESNTDEINDKRRMLVQMLFVEGNHFCPSCEKSGDCVLQAVAYDLGMLSAQFDHFFPDRPVDASHPELLLDFNRCILCELCVRASSEVDGKGVFALSGRGMTKHLIVNSESGRLADTNIAATDKAVDVCPVGVILKKQGAFRVPIGQRRFDATPISAQALHDAPRASDRTPVKDR